MFWLILVLYLCFSTPRQTCANEFSINKQIEFIVTNDLNLTVTEKLTLTNNYSQIFPTQYTHTISSSKPKNITAHDNKGNILTQFIPQPNDTIIQLKFNEPGIGKDKSTFFELSYQLENQITKRGKNYEVYLPTSSKQSNLVQAKITVPAWLGPLTTSSSPPQKLNASQHVYQFNPSQFFEPQRLIFGDQQIYDFELTYQLSNTSNNKLTQSIPFPPDTDRQAVTFTNILPPPINITTDLDGNYLAQYQLNPKSDLDVNAQGQIKLYPINTQEGEPQPAHFQPQMVWPSTDPTIQVIAGTLTNTKSIYDYVINTLSYNYNIDSSPGRIGALAALNNPTSSLCTEFTDLFITLARAKKIAAREIQGYVFTTNTRMRPSNPNTDFLHAWPQYYNSTTKKWVEIDPTWGKTTNGIDYFNTLDLNHIVFVIHGQDSHNPLPPGYYKRNNQLPSVKISLADTELIKKDQPPSIKIIIEQGQSYVNITNPNLHTLSNIEIKYANWQSTITKLPPLNHTKLKLQLPPFPQSLLPKNRYLNFVIKTSQNTKTQSLKNPNHFAQLTIVSTLAAICLLTSAIIIAKRYD